MGTKRDLEAIEQRRLKGARMLKSGVEQAEVARRLEVSRQAVSVWAAELAEKKGAIGKLRAKRLGRPSNLDEEQLSGLRAILLAGALTAGFPTQLWTIKRVRAVIKDRFDVEYSMCGCWNLLRGMGFSPQKPEKRATQRNEEAIATWKRKTWPALKKSPKPREERSSSSTNRVSRKSAP
jgi:transposase